MTSALDRLELQGYIVHKRDLSYRRKVIIELATRSKQIIEQIHNPIANEGTQLLYNFDESDLKVNYNYLCMDRDLYKGHRSRLKKEHIKHK